MRQSPIPSSAVPAIVLAPNPATETASFAREDSLEPAEHSDASAPEILEPDDGHYALHWGLNE